MGISAWEVVAGDVQHPEGPWRCALPGAEVEKEEHFPLYPPPPRRGEEPLAVCYRPPFLPRLFLSRFFTRQATPGSLGFFLSFVPPLSKLCSRVNGESGGEETVVRRRRGEGLALQTGSL